MQLRFCSDLLVAVGIVVATLAKPLSEGAPFVNALEPSARYLYG